jgi:hypothetical protein
VAVLLDGVLYPSAPLTQTTLSIPKPQNITEVSATTDSITISWNGYDATWDAVKPQIYVDSEFQDAATLDASATTYTFTGLTEETQYYLSVASVIDGTTYSAYPPDYIIVSTEAAPLPALLPLDNLSYSSEVTYGEQGVLTFNNPNDTGSLGGSYLIQTLDCQGNLLQESANASSSDYQCFYWYDDCLDANILVFENPYTITVVYTASDGRTASGTTVANPTKASLGCSPTLGSASTILSGLIRLPLAVSTDDGCPDKATLEGYAVDFPPVILVDGVEATSQGYTAAVQWGFDRIVVSSLTPETTYEFQVILKDNLDNEYTSNVITETTAAV